MIPMSSYELSTSLLSTSTIIAICLFFALLGACIIIGHLLEDHRWANESITALLLGLVAGVVVLLVSRGHSLKILVFSEDLFFLYLLPPIIFNAGFQVKKKQFFKNFTTILLFGVFGTVISFCVISSGGYFLFKKIGVTSLTLQDYLAIGAILSATDSVCTLQVLSQDDTPFLYSLVFGEGVVNDATSIVLFNAVQSLDLSDVNVITALKLLGTFLYLFFTSTILGIVMGLLSAYIIKTLYFGRYATHSTLDLSYMLAELISLSGILTVFFCGIVMSHYTWHNVTESSRITTNAGTSIALSSTLVALLMIGRAAFVFPLANLANCCKSNSTRISLKEQLIVWWAGLMRGAVTIALSYNQFATSSSESSINSLMITSTIIVVLFSTMVFGSITKPLIEAVLLKNSKSNLSDATDFNPSFDDLRLPFLEQGEEAQETESESKAAGLRFTTRTVHYFWRKFDDRFMRPVFGGRGFVPFVPSTPTGAVNPSTSSSL